MSLLHVHMSTAAKIARMVSLQLNCILKLFSYQARILLITVFNTGTHTVIDVFLILQMYGY